MMNQPEAVPLPQITNDSEQVLDQLCINALRILAMDAVQQANSGHPVLPLGAAPMAYVLWKRYLRHNPANPSWPDRDRFVFSAGPTHQPVEYLASLRAIPLLVVIRPADAPGDPSTPPDLVLLGTGSEVALCLSAREQLAAHGIRTRVVSMPSWELFDEQPVNYRAAVLGPVVCRDWPLKQVCARAGPVTQESGVRCLAYDVLGPRLQGEMFYGTMALPLRTWSRERWAY